MLFQGGVGLTFQAGVPWVNLLEWLGNHGAYIQNYPHGVPPPNAPVGGKKSKGIKNLLKAHRDAMINQMAHGSHPMTFVSIAVQGTYRHNPRYYLSCL